MNAIPNWYDDPYDNRQLRYFDGQQWTAHTSPKYAPPQPMQLQNQHQNQFSEEQVQVESGAQQKILEDAATLMGGKTTFTNLISGRITLTQQQIYFTDSDGAIIFTLNFPEIKKLTMSRLGLIIKPHTGKTYRLNFKGEVSKGKTAYQLTSLALLGEGSDDFYKGGTADPGLWIEQMRRLGLKVSDQRMGGF